jgi:UDP-glucose 4-epimerase
VDLAQAAVAAVTRRPEGPSVFNLGGGRGYSLHELLGVLEEVTGRTPRVEYHEARMIDPPVVSLDISRAERHLGWRPRVDLREGVGRTWEWIRRAAENA